MSTDDGEDGSSSTALSHAPGEASSEGTSASGPGPPDHKLRWAAGRGQYGPVSACRSPPFIKPSSLEILRALVQEIRSSGDTDPDLWKACEDRWLHLFQLVEKQYQEQIRAQRRQYRRQIQLIQDEIKALVQLQTRQPAPGTHWSADPKDDLLTHSPVFGDASDPAGSGDRAGTLLSSGYGTLSAWAGPDEPPVARREDVPPAVRPHASTCRTLTSWAQRQKKRSTRVKVLDQSRDGPNSPEQALDGSGPRRSDSAMSELSGLTYWRLHEDQLYHALPDSWDQGHQQTPLEPSLSLREIYQNKQLVEGSVRSSPLSAQVWTADPAGGTRHSDRTSGFTSPSHFSSPSFAVPLGSGPDGAARSSPNQADTDCISEVSSGSTAGPVGRSIRTRGKVKESCTDPDAPVCGSGPSVDPVVLSLLRQNLRDKHTRHVSDLRAYYESEIRTLREQLLPEDQTRSQQLLTERCQHLEQCVSEAKQRVQHLEASNRQLEEKLEEWPQRYAVATATVESLQQRQDSAMTRLKSRVVRLEEQLKLSGQEAELKEAQRQQEQQALQELLQDYDSLAKQHSGLRNQLLFTENKLSDANDRIGDLKTTVSKLETQMKQLEHQNQARLRQSLRRPSGAGSVPPPQPEPAPVFRLQHPDLLTSPRRLQTEPDVTQLPDPPGPGSGVLGPTDRRCSSPPERDLAPMMRALVQLEESRAPWGGRQWKQRQKEVQREVAARSSSLPPNIWATPTKRASLLTPVSSKCSPKRCPSDNYSTALGYMMPREEHLDRMDTADRGHSLSPRKRLQFTYPAQDPSIADQPESGSTCSPAADRLESPEPTALEAPQTRNLTRTEAQELCDQLTQEKLQIEAALNRAPGPGARVGSQRRSDQEVLERRLEQVTRSLVWAGRTLKRLKVLGSAAV